MPVLYLGSDPTRYQEQRSETLIHFPVLEIVPRSLDSLPIVHLLTELPFFTHTIVTSKSTVAILGTRLLELKNIFAIGKSTAAALQVQGVLPRWVADEETQEGIISQLRLLDWTEDAYVFLPRSSLARSALENYFIFHNIRHQVCDLYDTKPRATSPPSLDAITEIVFTSPSTVHAFSLLFPTPPPNILLTPLGPITTEALRLYAFT